MSSIFTLPLKLNFYTARLFCYGFLLPMEVPDIESSGLNQMLSKFKIILLNSFPMVNTHSVTLSDTALLDLRQT